MPYKLSYRDLAEMMDEQGVSLAHSTILRWFQRSGINPSSVGLSPGIPFSLTAIFPGIIQGQHLHRP